MLELLPLLAVNDRPGGDRRSAIATLPTEANVARGNAAVDRALRVRRDVPRAMRIRRLGLVAFPWGKPGAAGYGISHIVAKRGEAAARILPQVLAHGAVAANEAGDRHTVSWKGWTATVELTDRARIVRDIERAGAPRRAALKSLLELMPA